MLSGQIICTTVKLKKGVLFKQFVEQKKNGINVSHSNIIIFFFSIAILSTLILRRVGFGVVHLSGV